MDSIFFILFSMVSIALSFILFKEVAGTMSIRRLNMLSYLFYVPLFLMSALGALFIVLKIDNHYLINKIRFDETRLYGWLAIQYTLVTFPIGILIAKKFILKSTTNDELINYNLKPIVFLQSNNDFIVRSFLMALSFFGVLVLLYTFKTMGVFPILELLKGNSASLAKIRIESAREFSGNIYLRNIFAIQLLPLLAFISFAYYEKTKKVVDFIWFGICLIASILILTYDLQKSPLALFLSGFLFYYTWVKGSLPFWKVSLFIVSFFAIITLFYLGFGHQKIEQILLVYNEGASGRVLFSQIAGTFFSFELFNQNNEFIGFSSLSTFVEGFGIDYSERAGRIIMEVINPKGIEEKTAGVQNTLFIGEAWANFGLIGLILSPFYVGFLIACLFYLLLRLPKTPIFIGLYVFFSYKTALIGGFNDYIYNMSNFLVLTILVLIIFLSFRIQNKIVKA